MDLLLTLGHNSSAIAVEGNRVIRGYEEERLTRKKSDSSFPINAIKRCAKDTKIDKIYISHWYDDFNFYEKEGINETLQRHFNKKALEAYSSNIVSLTPSLTHHDAHANSAVAFFKTNWKKNVIFNGHVVISDGFGNGQEVTSIYKVRISNMYTNLTLVDRFFGYKNSMGLMYQYATSFCGMKENEDEYKFLGYESHIKEYFDAEQIHYLETESDNYASNMYFRMKYSGSNFHPNYIHLDKLMEAKALFQAEFRDLIARMPSPRNLTTFETRVFIGYFIQSVIEHIYAFLIRDYKIDNVIVSGGLHFNVKLNNSILETIPGYFCAMPLAGDQGTALGLYASYHPDLEIKDLCWGDRELEQGMPKQRMAEIIVEDLLKNKVPEIVTGAMEFGPRALCHTSTLSLAFAANIDYINAINGRDTVMPMAPVMLRENMEYFFDIRDYVRVVGSDKYMIVTYDYKENLYPWQYQGVMHKYPLENRYSGRPQVIDDRSSVIGRALTILDKEGIKAIVNHSFNVHGTPIVYNRFDAEKNFDEQLSLAAKAGLDTDKIDLVIG